MNTMSSHAQSLRAVCFLLRCQRKNGPHTWNCWSFFFGVEANYTSVVKFFPKIFQNVQKEMATFCGFLVASFMDKSAQTARGYLNGQTPVTWLSDSTALIGHRFLVSLKREIWFKNNYLLHFFPGQVIYDSPVATRPGALVIGFVWTAIIIIIISIFQFGTPLIGGDTATAAVPMK